MKLLFLFSYFMLFMFHSFLITNETTAQTISSKEIINGIEICRITNNPLFERQLYSFTETLSLGGEEPTPKLYQPWQLLLDDKGNFYVVDEHRIKKFSNNGNFIKNIGDIGKGPGEFSTPFLRYILKDTLYVSNFSSSRYELFNLDGSYLKTVNFKSPSKTLLPNSANKSVFYLSENIFLYKSYSQLPRGYSQVSKCKFGLSSKDGEFLKELEFEIDEWVRWISEGNLYVSMPYVLTDFIVKFNGNLYILSQNGSEIFVASRNGDYCKIIKFDIKGKKISRKEKNETLSKYDIPMKNLINKVGLPKTKPLISDIVVDESNRLWLKKGDNFRTSPSDIQSYTYMIIDQEGNYISNQTLPIDLKVVKSNIIYGYEVDDDGLSILKRYKLIKNEQ